MADDRRQIAEVLGDWTYRGRNMTPAEARSYASTLLPLIDRVKAEAAADALEDAAATYDEAWPGIDPLTIDLRVRAAALRAAHTATDAQETK